MKKLIVLSLLAALAAIPLTAAAAEAGVYADVLSAYVYNGQLGNDEPVFQPGLYVDGPLGLGYSLWANMDLTDSDNSWYPGSDWEWSEIDLGLYWNAPLEGPVSLSFGGIYYVYPQASSTVEESEDGTVTASRAPADGSYEVYAQATADELPLAPSLKWCHDLDKDSDWIAMFILTHSFSLTDKLALDLTGTVSYAGDYYVNENYGSTAGSSFTHAQIDAFLNYALNEKATVGLKASYSSILDSTVRDDIDETDFYAETDIFFGGVYAGYSF